MGTDSTDLTDNCRVERNSPTNFFGVLVDPAVIGAIRRIRSLQFLLWFSLFQLSFQLNLAEVVLPRPLLGSVAECRGCM
ncbi:MAG: hypothetical protein JWL61_4116 [Gemmatimonadetes bacterium]|nr:hypothetical protein [Gemmatimonadota bacterium]